MTTVTCPKCGTENYADAMNCKNCKVNLKYAFEHLDEMEFAREHPEQFGLITQEAIRHEQESPSTGEQPSTFSPSAHSETPLMTYEYKMIQVPPNIVLKAKEVRGNEAAHYLQSIANEQAAAGWEFYRVDTVGVVTQPGCLPSLFGAKQTLIEYYVVTFRKAK
jgi:hypothetical protein